MSMRIDGAILIRTNAKAQRELPTVAAMGYSVGDTSSQIAHVRAHDAGICTGCKNIRPEVAERARNPLAPIPDEMAMEDMFVSDGEHTDFIPFEGLFVLFKSDTLCQVIPRIRVGTLIVTNLSLAYTVLLTGAERRDLVQVCEKVFGKDVVLPEPVEENPSGVFESTHAKRSKAQYN